MRPRQHPNYPYYPQYSHPPQQNIHQRSPPSSYYESNPNQSQSPPQPLLPIIKFKTVTTEENAIAVDSKISYKRPSSKCIQQPDPKYRDAEFTNPLSLQYAQHWEYLIEVNRWLPGQGTFITHNKYRYIIGPPIHLGINGHIHYCYRYPLAQPHKPLLVETFAAKIIPNISAFKREFIILQQLQNSENVTTLYDIIESKQTLIAILELAQADGYNFFTKDIITKFHGWDLHKIAVREHFAKMTISNIVNGLDSVHKSGFLHCDLKTLNILLYIYITNHSIKKGGVYFKAKLTDFGHSYSGDRYITKKGSSSGMSKIGTAGYVAPELFIEGNECTEKIDIWALGMVLFAILIPGQLLFGEYTNIETLKLYYNKYILSTDMNDKPFWWSDFERLSLESRDLIYWMIQWDPNQRPTCSEILNHSWFKIGKKGHRKHYKPQLKYIDIQSSNGYE